MKPNAEKPPFTAKNKQSAGRSETSDEIHSLIQTFEYFTETTEKLRVSYDKLQEKISELDLELEKKNRKLYLNLRKMDSIKNHLEYILKSMNMGVVVLNLDGIVSMFNPAAAEITGYSSEEIVGKPYSSFLGKDVAEEVTPLLTLHQGIEKTNKEKIIYTKNGVAIPIEYSTSMVRNELGEVLGVVEIFSDLRDIKQLQEELQQAQTLAALGEMAGNVAHEIRNPLGGIGGFAALLERDLDVEDPRRNLVVKIIEGVSRLNRIATNLLVYTRPVRPKKRLENIIQVVDDVLTLIQVELEQDESKIILKKKYSFKQLDVPIDPELFQQVFLNIAKNAVQVMNDSGEILVTVKMIKRTEKVEIAVRDTGPGIPEEDQKKLFMPFFTTKADGTGLGLSIAKKIMEVHNGEITVDSEVGRGTTFRIFFPY